MTANRCSTLECATTFKNSLVSTTPILSNVSQRGLGSSRFASPTVGQTQQAEATVRNVNSDERVRRQAGFKEADALSGTGSETSAIMSSKRAICDSHR